ncbi:putative cytochrome P450 6a21 [Haematobia irritans]|uniref:putative cytochrome P450 6a21 n=1 Tax=Haematobia irritans TaxID=7368 RepID=UPI003F509D7F
MITTILWTLFYALLIYVWQRLRKHFSYWHNLGIPCSRPHWIVGNLQEITFISPFCKIWQKYYDKHRTSGPFVGFYWFTQPGVFVMDPQLIKNILIKDFTKFSDHGLYCNEKDDPMTGSLFNLEGHKWREMRRKTTATFSSARMKSMFPLVTKEANEFIAVMTQQIRDNSIVEVKDLLWRFTTDAMASCAFGIEANSLHKPDPEFQKMCKRALLDQRWGIVFRLSFPHLARRLCVKHTPADVEEYFMDITMKMVNSREQSALRRNDFLDMLIDLKNNKLLKASPEGMEMTNLTLGQLAAHVLQFILGGFETSSTAMSFAFYELAQNQEVQQKAREEVVQVMNQHHGEFTYECIWFL